MKKSIYALLFIHLIVFVISCDKAEDSDMASAPQGSEMTTVGNTTHGECKSLYTRTISELVQLKTTNNGLLNIKHIDAILNCAAGKITFDCNAGNGIIYITEKEESTSANCTCPYDLEYTVKLPGYGKYKLIINGYEFGEFDFKANTDITLNKRLSPSM
ncbi:hypothetical protein [Bacteroides sp. 51]|uniref:hypothetical protein n=1 Tax=Bacteroides sp. 51 TaxID=2302938 RepID=UPI0013D8C7B7|nr:hypothetical protein [Bacteroides sp. 51]NDV81089.1 hypothetical protein [Bacteroides sp. 51]